MYYSGTTNVPGAPGNLLAGGGPKLPLAGTSNLNSAVANMTPGAPGNFAGFYGGPQIGQAPVGFAAKTVYS